MKNILVITKGYSKEMTMNEAIKLTGATEEQINEAIESGNSLFEHDVVCVDEAL